jgi:hypothetical protein
MLCVGHPVAGLEKDVPEEMPRKTNRTTDCFKLPIPLAAQTNEKLQNLDPQNQPPQADFAFLLLSGGTKRFSVSRFRFLVSQPAT